MTALSYGIAGSTDLLHVVDIDDFQELVASVQGVAQEAIASCSGVLRAESGDGGIAVFPAQQGSGDAASLAIRAGLKIVEACKRLGRDAGHVDLSVRVGVATSVEFGPDRRGENTKPQGYADMALTLASRLEAAVPPDSVFVCEESRRLAGRSYTFVFEGTRTLEGIEQPERVWRALDHHKKVDRPHVFRKRGGNLIGRAAALQKIAAIWDSVRAGRGEVLCIEGEPGIGKSRLLREVRRLTREKQSKFLLFQSQPEGLLSPLHPFVSSLPSSATDEGDTLQIPAAVVARLFEHHGIRDAEIVDLFAHLLGARDAEPTFSDISPLAIRMRALRAVTGALQLLCATGPLVLAVEDVHWLDRTSKDLLFEAIRVARHFPVLIVMTSPTAFEMDRSDAAHTTRLSLEPFSLEEAGLAMRARGIGQRRKVRPELIEMAEHISGGVPLFVEEVCRWISDGLAAKPENVPDRAAVSHRADFDAMLEARLSHLGGTARTVASACTVAGSQTTLPLLRILLPDSGRKSLARAVETLVEAGFLVRTRTPGSVAYGFRHTLLREVIYGGMPQKQQQLFHRRLFLAVSRDRMLAPWIDSVALAGHAEQAGLTAEAAELLIGVGDEFARRSAMIESRHHLEHALSLCATMPQSSMMDTLQLSALIALGPVLSATGGANSPATSKLYEDGVAVARRQPLEDQPKWFLVYWRWCFAGRDFRDRHERALQLPGMLAGVVDTEIKLQIRHCIWSIDFNLGRHRETQDAIREGLALYDAKAAKASRTVFGGHDAKVSALGQLALSLWLTGQRKASDETLSRMVAYVHEISHVPSKAYSLDIEAVSAFYRDDHRRLIDLSERMSEFAEEHEMQSLAGMSRLFAGWALAHRGDLVMGHDMFRDGLSQLRELGIVVDLPIYLYMHATMLGLAHRYEAGIEIATEAIAQAQETGHTYWLAELYRRRAVLRSQGISPREAITADLKSAIAIAEEQGAIALLQRTRHSTRELGLVV
ncbi:AAA family ATPase [Sinorhizobium sp. BG8]|uniref:ATP-binding protein n=1 Tax=Sinorhizobium sp. BG8 TaxID=2613773 RepID=UPI001FF06020|nr:AAA family ATPase [Sinorhizobium sp. BG8]